MKMQKMQKINMFAVILSVAVCGLLASCATVSEAQKQKSETVQTAPPAAEKTPPARDSRDLNEPTAEQIKNGSVKSNDYEENMKSPTRAGDLCRVEAFIADTDKNGLNVRRENSAKSAIVGKIPFSEDGTIVQLTGTDFAGWVKIGRAENMEGEQVFGGAGWVSGNLLATSTTGYGTKGVKLYEAGQKTKVLAIVPPETVVRIVSCDKDWVRVKYKKFTGWLAPEAQCGNPVTNCS